jgi:Ni/Co efflux regulator RcnB
MRKLVLTCIAATLVTTPMVGVVKAEDTTVIKRDHRDGDRTVIEKREELNILPVPHTEEKTIIKKERD